jgi:hypothetical protein
MNDDFYQWRLDKEFERAKREGQFDDLPGKGKPIDWTDWNNPYVKPEDQIVHIILNNAGYASEWVAQRREIVELTDGARSNLARTWTWVKRHGGLVDARAAREWDRALRVFHSAADEINMRIRDHNLMLPAELMALAVLDIEAEIEKIKGERVS